MVTTEERAGERTDRRHWAAFIVCAIGASLPVMDVTRIYVVAPSLTAAFPDDPIVTQLVIGGFLIAFGLSLIPAGRLGDLSSRRRVFLFGVALFTVASLAVGFAPGPVFLVLARVVQGIAGGIVSPQVIGLIQQLFRGDARARAFGILGAVFGLASSFAPALGGLLIGLGGDAFGWRLAFLFNVPVGLAVFVVALWTVPHHTQTAAVVRDYDPIGTLLLGLATVGLLVPFVFAGGGDGSWLRWLSLPLAAVVAVLFVLWEHRYARRGRVPLIELGLFRHASYRLGTIVQIGFNVAMPALLLVVSLQLQTGWGMSALVAGIVAIPPSVSYAVAAYFASRRGVQKARRTIVIGLTGFLAALLALAVIGLSVPLPAVVWIITVAYGMSGIAGGFIIPANQASSMMDVPVAQGGLAGSIQQVGQRFGIAVGTSVVSAVYLQIVRSGTDSVVAFAVCVGIAALIVALTLVVAVVDVRRGSPQLG
jgi:MFS family permease